MCYIYHKYEISKMSQGIQQSKNMKYKLSNYKILDFCKKVGSFFKSSIFYWFLVWPRGEHVGSCWDEGLMGRTQIKSIKQKSDKITNEIIEKL